MTASEPGNTSGTFEPQAQGAQQTTTQSDNTEAASANPSNASNASSSTASSSAGSTANTGPGMQADPERWRAARQAKIGSMKIDVTRRSSNPNVVSPLSPSITGLYDPSEPTPPPRTPSYTYPETYYPQEGEGEEYS